MGGLFQHVSGAFTAFDQDRMRIMLQWATGIAMAATMLTALFGATGSGAWAKENIPVLIPEKIEPQFVSEPVVQNVSEAVAQDTPAQEDEAEDTSQRHETLAAHVEAQSHEDELDRQMHCLASAIYFEARGESLAGQLAVGRVIVERSTSGRFPDSYCGVVFQRSQFSFVRGSKMPTIRESSSAWRRAVKVAKIAHEGSWESQAEGALFFHATRVSPGWRLKRLARVDNHVFYR